MVVFGFRFSSATFSPSDESGDVSVAVGTALFEVVLLVDVVFKISHDCFLFL